MSDRRLVMAMLAASLLLPAPAPAAGTGAGGHEAPASPQAGVSRPAGPPVGGSATQPVAAAATEVVVWLRGPFGRVAGGSLQQPAAAAPDDRPLDAWARRVPLFLEPADDVAVSKLEIRAQPFEAAGDSTSLSSGALAFEGPDGVGEQLIVAEVTTAAGDVSQHAWLIDVPDREPPADGLLDIPAPDVIVASTAGRLAGRPGSGCYAFLCVDAGYAPAPEVLDVLEATVGEVLRLQLGDGSAITAWHGNLTPLDGTAATHLEAGGSLTDTPEAIVDLVGLQPTAAGRWLLALEIEFDRERGWLRTFSLLDVAGQPEARPSEATGG